MIRETSGTTPTSSPNTSPVTPRKEITDFQVGNKESTLFPQSMNTTSSGMVAGNSPEKDKTSLSDDQKSDNNRSEYFQINSSTNSQPYVATEKDQESQSSDPNDNNFITQVKKLRVKWADEVPDSSGKAGVLSGVINPSLGNNILKTSKNGSLPTQAIVISGQLKSLSEFSVIDKIMKTPQATIFHVESHDRMKVILPLMLNGDMAALADNGVKDYQTVLKTLRLLEYNIIELYNKTLSDSQFGGSHYRLPNELYIQVQSTSKGIFYLVISNGLSLNSSKLIFSRKITEDELRAMVDKLKINIKNCMGFSCLPIFNEDKDCNLEISGTVLPRLSSLKKEDVYTIFYLPCNDKFSGKAINRLKGWVFKKEVEVGNTLLGDVLAEYSCAPFKKEHEGLNMKTNAYSAVIDGLTIPTWPKGMHSNLLSGVYACLLYIAEKSTTISSAALNNNNATISDQTIDLKIYGVGNGAYNAASVYSYIQDIFDSNKARLSDFQEFCKENKLPPLPKIGNIKKQLENVIINYYLYLSNPSRGNITPNYAISRGLPIPYGKKDSVFIILTNALYGEREGGNLNKLHDITSHIKVSDPIRIKLICISEHGFMDDTESSNKESNSLSRQLTYKFFGMDSLNKSGNEYKKDASKGEDFTGNTTPKRQYIHAVYSNPLYFGKIKYVLRNNNSSTSPTSTASSSRSSSSSSASSLDAPWA